MDIEQTIQTKTHDDFYRKAKLCIKCNEHINMPSSSYCKPCMRQYDKGRRAHRALIRVQAYENFINKGKDVTMKVED